MGFTSALVNATPLDDFLQPAAAIQIPKMNKEML
jgi:hypothetical protein